MASDEVLAGEYVFEPSGYDVPALGEVLPPLLDLTDAPVAVWDAAADDVDEAVAAAIAETEDAVALWRAFRWEAADTTGVTARRVYVAEVGTAAALQTVEAAVLAAAADDTPVVECFATGTAAGPHAQAALGRSALLWTKEQDGPVTVARVFDYVDPNAGPGWFTDHPTLDDDEAAAVARYLDGGSPVLVTTATTVDARDPAQGPVVPMSYRTDGRWVWIDALTYYVRAHGLAPEPQFLDHIYGSDFVPAAVSPADAHRAVAALLVPGGPSPGWGI